MRIAVLAHARHPISEPFCGGLEAHTADTVDALVRRGHQVTLFAKADSRTTAELVAIAPASLTYGQSYRGKVDRAELALDVAYGEALDTIELGGFDAVLNNSLSPVPYARRLGVGVLTVLHTPATLERVNAVLEDPDWRCDPLHAFAAVSETTARDWRGRLPRLPAIPNGVDLAHWRPRTLRPLRDRAVWSGRITPEKGLHVAIAAARLAGWRLDISGPIANPTYFQDRIAPLLGPDVRYRGHLRRDALRTFLADGAVLLFSPMWAEPFGLAAVEAMACGTPVASLPAGAAAEIVDADGGVLAVDDSPAALAQALVAAARLDRRHVRLSAHRYDQSRMIEAYERVLTDLALSAEGSWETSEDADLV